MLRAFLGSLAAHVRQARSLFVLTVVGVALGVAAVLAIQIINRSALAAFEGSLQAVSGDADLTVLGRTPTLPDSLLVEVLATPGIVGAWPMVRVPVALADSGVSRLETTFLDIVGVDLFAPVEIPWEAEAGPADPGAALASPGWAAVTPALAEQRGWAVGDTVRVWAGSTPSWIVVAGLVDFQKATPTASPRLVVMDIAQAQARFGRPGHLQQIDVRLAETADAGAVRRDLAQRLGDRARILSPEDQRAQTRGLLAAFRLNLTALSLISLFVGLFLVYSATQASLVRRRAEFGTLRSLGATRTQVLGLILAEVALLGVLGVALGLPLGYAAARMNIDVVSSALTNLFLLDSIHRLQVPPTLLLTAGAIGIGGALAGALIPALDMSRRHPRELLSAFTLHERIDRLSPRLAAVGSALVVGAGLWYVAGGRQWQHAGFVLAVALLAGLPLLTPWVLRTLARPLRPSAFGPVYSLKSLGARLQGSAFAVAALGIAVSMLVGITIMVGSFRDTLEVWIHTTVQADVYVSPAAWRGPGHEAFLDEGLAQRLTEHPGVRAVDRLRGMEVFTAADEPVVVAGVDVGLPQAERRFTLLQGDPAIAFDRVHGEGHVLVGETLARRKDLWVGDRIELHTAGGLQAFEIAGVYYDYDARGGGLLMDLRTLRAHWRDDSLNGIALYLESGRDADEVIDELRAALPAQALDMVSNRRLRGEAMEIFDQTFAVTRLLQGISLLIAVCGVTLMLLVMAREQSSELALYRAVGATRRQLFGLFVGKGAGIGGLGLILGGVSGVLLALVLIFVINRAYFGWTIQLHWPWVPFLEQAATILLATIAASLYPAWRASRTPASELRREDV